MAWYAYEFWASDDGESWRDITDVAPHPAWRLAFAVEWADGEVNHRTAMARFAFLRLRRRQGTYRPRGSWRTVAEWRHGQLQAGRDLSEAERAVTPAASEAQK